MKMMGYVVVPPVNAWDNREVVFPLLSYNTLGKTPTEAWLRFLQTTVFDSLRVNRAIDRGYRLRRASMEILEEVEDANTAA
jgi:hypothetical protein